MLTSYVLPLSLILISLIGLWVAVPNIAIWLLIAELCWIGLYIFYALLGLSFDAIHVAAWCFFILGLATSESALGLSLLIFNFFRTNNIAGARLTFNHLKTVGTRHGTTRH